MAPSESQDVLSHSLCMTWLDFLSLGKSVFAISQVIACQMHGSDERVVPRVISLLAAPMSHWELLGNPSYAEWVGFKVRHLNPITEYHQ